MKTIMDRCETIMLEARQVLAETQMISRETTLTDVDLNTAHNALEAACLLVWDIMVSRHEERKS